MDAAAAGARPGAWRAKKDPAAGGVWRGAAEGHRGAAQARIRSPDRRLAGRSLAGSGAGTVAVPATRTGTAKAGTRATAVDPVDLRSVGQTLGRDVLKQVPDPAVTVLMAV